MRRSLVTVVTLLAGLLVPTGLAAAPAQAACQPPNDQQLSYKFRNKEIVYHPTSLMSAWQVGGYGGSITYNKTATKEVNASVTATVSAEAGVIFAKASTSLGVTVGGSYSRSESWSHTMNLPANKNRMYRMRQYHFSVNFEVMKKSWSHSDCDWTNNVWSAWQDVKHAPERNESGTVWRLEEKPA